MAAFDRAGLLLAAVALTAVAGCQASASSRTAQSTQARAAGFSWFAARPAPAGWPTVTLPDRTATLAYPRSARRTAGDPGTVTVATGAADDPLLYLNATPQQGGETAANWSRFRIEHLADDDANGVGLDAKASRLTFRGGAGSCVLDHYRSRVGNHAYREIACLVVGAHGTSVLIAAAPSADWSREAGTLERAVDAYQVR